MAKYHYFCHFPGIKKADNGSRTRDLYITNVALYHLSYISILTDAYRVNYCIIQYKKENVNRKMMHQMSTKILNFSYPICLCAAARSVPKFQPYTSRMR